jgi:hypothetical protein
MATLGVTLSTTEFPEGGGGSGDLVVLALPGEMGKTTSATFAIDTSGNVPTPEMRLPDGSTESLYASVKVPATATSISSIRVIYRRKATGNVRLVFYTAIWDLDSIGSAKAEDITDTLATYAMGAADSSLGAFTVPSAAYNALTIEEGDLFVFQMDRAGADASDSLTDYLPVLAIEITFA